MYTKEKEREVKKDSIIYDQMIESNEIARRNMRKIKNQALRVGTLHIIRAALLGGRLAALFLVGDAFLVISIMAKQEREDVRFGILLVILA